MIEPFSSKEKSLVRTSCLQEIIILKDKVGRRINYLGLPSPWMGDIVTWRRYIENVFAVEMEERFIPDLVDKAYTLGLLYNLHYYVGNIDVILQKGYDNYQKSLGSIFPVDLVNLDYCGGLVYEGFERISAIESLLRNQAIGIQNRKPAKFPYFLLFITHSSTHNNGKQRICKEYLTYLIRDAAIYQQDIRLKLEDVCNWYLSDQCPVSYRHKVFVFGKVLEFAEARGFRVEPRTAIMYKGDNDKPMMHYQFRIHPHNVGYPVPTNSKFNLLNILDWPVRDINGQDIVPSGRPTILNNNSL